MKRAVFSLVLIGSVAIPRAMIGGNGPCYENSEIRKKCGDFFSSFTCPNLPCNPLFAGQVFVGWQCFKKERTVTPDVPIRQVIEAGGGMDMIDTPSVVCGQERPCSSECAAPEPGEIPKCQIDSEGLWDDLIALEQIPGGDSCFDGDFDG